MSFGLVLAREELIACTPIWVNRCRCVQSCGHLCQYLPQVVVVFAEGMPFSNGFERAFLLMRASRNGNSDGDQIAPGDRPEPNEVPFSKRAHRVRARFWNRLEAHTAGL